jgi:hypothetical protein
MKLSLVLLLSLSLFTYAYQLPTISPDDDAFLDDLERASFLFFWEQADSETGQVKDRSFTNGTEDNRPIASIASTGFGLTALAIAHNRNYLDREKIVERVHKTLDFIWTKLDGHMGFYYHFVDMHTGKREWNCELSSIDTAILINGVLTVRSYFSNDSMVKSLATNIYERVNYTWMFNDGKYLSMGWKPESGFLNDNWDRYCELMMLVLQAIGSPTHPIPVKAWDSFRRPVYEYKGISYITVNDPLFIHQFSHAWFDFYNKKDKYTDYFLNSVNATKVHKLWSITDLAANISSYTNNFWGITASDTPYGYDAWGGPPGRGNIDGTVVPCAAAGSIPFLPHDTIAVLRNFKVNFSRSWDRYGFIDAFNPVKNWYNPDVIGIDVGITILMAENYRTGFVWANFMKNKEVIEAMDLVGFKNNSSVGGMNKVFVTVLVFMVLFFNFKV